MCPCSVQRWLKVAQNDWRDGGWPPSCNALQLPLFYHLLVFCCFIIIILHQTVQLASCLIYALALPAHPTICNCRSYGCILLLNQIYLTTRNAFCGTWYLPHSHIHNERTVPIIMSGCTEHARNGRISTSGEKSDVTIMFLDPIS